MFLHRLEMDYAVHHYSFSSRVGKKVLLPCHKLFMVSGLDTERFQCRPTTSARRSRKCFASRDDGNGTWKGERGGGGVCTIKDGEYCNTVQSPEKINFSRRNTRHVIVQCCHTGSFHETFRRDCSAICLSTSFITVCSPITPLCFITSCCAPYLLFVLV